MPLNYSKWDQLELSDDSDIEGHPNVDKRSLIRWKQRDIHQQREQRKHKIASLKTEIACNNVLLGRLDKIFTDLTTSSSPTTFFNSLVEHLKKDPSPDAPPVNSLGERPTITYDAMVLSLLLEVVEAAKKNAEDADAEKLGQALVDGLRTHIGRLTKVQADHATELATEEREKSKRITTEDLHDGFDNKYVPPKPTPPAIPVPSMDKPRKTETSFEVLNPKASSSSAPPPDQEDNDEETVSLPQLTPSLVAFSNLPYRGYQESWEFIQSHREVVVPGASDALLVAAFTAQSEGKSKYAKQCVHQSLLLQYCDKLGVDGVRVFFKRMIEASHTAEKVFIDDVEKTYNHLVERVRVHQEESSAAEAGAEQIQLVPENPSQSISFNVPDGPPPPNLTLEGPGTENLNIEDVRNMLQLKWDIFSGFSEELQTALKEGTLDGVNRVLGAMSVPEAEQIVQSLDMAGILSFAEGGIRDETGQDEAGDDAEVEENVD